VDRVLTFATGLGVCGVAWGDAGITDVRLPGADGPRGTAVEDAAEVPAAIRAAIAGMTALLAGAAVDLRDVVVDERALDPFRRAVFAATRAIGPGEVATYGAIARVVGQPGAARAVGAALGSNPYPIVVPCHRVLAADGALTGFSAPGGTVTKRRMLEIEGAPGFRQEALFASF
jgi:methylated-DNA-[protein]-cysteine S-methyltransferase